MYFTHESKILILEDLFYTWHAFVTCFYLNRQNNTSLQVLFLTPRKVMMQLFLKVTSTIKR